MRIRMINAQTGGLMYVEESRLPEYLAAGHLPAVRPPEPPEVPAAGAAPDAPKKTARKKTAGK